MVMHSLVALVLLSGLGTTEAIESEAQAEVPAKKDRPGFSVGMSLGLTTASLDASYWLNERWTIDGRLAGAGNEDGGGVGIMFGATRRYVAADRKFIDAAWTLSGGAGVVEEFCIFCSGSPESGPIVEGSAGLSVTFGRFLELSPEVGAMASNLFGVAPVARVNVAIGYFGR